MQFVLHIHEKFNVRGTFKLRKIGGVFAIVGPHAQRFPRVKFFFWEFFSSFALWYQKMKKHKLAEIETAYAVKEKLLVLNAQSIVNADSLKVT